MILEDIATLLEATSLNTRGEGDVENDHNKDAVTAPRFLGGVNSKFTNFGLYPAWGAVNGAAAGAAGGPAGMALGATGGAIGGLAVGTYKQLTSMPKGYDNSLFRNIATKK